MVPDRPNQEDVIINKCLGKRLSREDEFLFEFEQQERMREVKRRLLEKNSNGMTFDSIIDFSMHSDLSQKDEEGN